MCLKPLVVSVFQYRVSVIKSLKLIHTFEIFFFRWACSEETLGSHGKIQKNKTLGRTFSGCLVH